MVVCAAYRPVSSPDDDISLLEHIDTMIPRLRPNGTQIIIAGDFNVHNRAWICSNRTTTAAEFAEDVCLDHGLQQHIVVPTRGSNTLDLVMSDFARTPAMHYFPPSGKSDHCIVVAKFCVPLRREPKTTRTGGTKMQTGTVFVTSFVHWTGQHSCRTMDLLAVI